MLFVPFLDEVVLQLLELGSQFLVLLFFAGVLFFVLADPVLALFELSQQSFLALSLCKHAFFQDGDLSLEDLYLIILPCIQQ